MQSTTPGATHHHDHHATPYASTVRHVHTDADDAQMQTTKTNHGRIAGGERRGSKATTWASIQPSN
eukprot:m.79923 g.79923  ORF g.79923 m.79923 type:complete len:66 (+) comp19333_c0_seq2:87-284(+)